MWLTNLSINRPIVILMLFSTLMVLGLRSRSSMPVDLYPKIDIPYIVIMTIYPGAGPEEIETLVSKPIEDGVGSIGGMKTISSTSQEGMSAVSIEFEIGTDLDDAAAEVRSRVDSVRYILPDDVQSPVVRKIDIGAMPVLWMGMSSRRPVLELRQLADDVIKDRLGKCRGVAAVTVTGGDTREIQVNVDKRRLEAYGLSINQISQALSMGNLNLPSGRITEGTREYAVRAVGEFSSVDEIRDLRISVPDGIGGSRVLTIGDVAEVVDGTAERQEVTRLQRKESIGLLVTKQSDANTVDVAKAVKKELDRMKGVLPSDIEIGISYDQSNQVEEALHDVNTALVLGAILAVFIVFLFLHSIRGTFIVAIAIPTSMVAAFIPIYFAGFTTNMMVMLGLSLAVGILVDDSIVVLENIYRHLAAGEEPRVAALKGRSEIGLAAVTITLVDVVVFVPIAFMGGMVGQFFKEFGITIASATLFSLFVSFTLTPMLASRWYRHREAVEAQTGFFAKFDAFYHKLDRQYRRLLEWALGHRWQVLASGFCVLMAILFLGGRSLGFEFSPKMDQGQVNVSVEMPVGSSLAATDSVITQVENVLAEIPEIESIFTNLGSSRAGVFGGTTGANYGQISAGLHEKESVMDRFLRPLLRGHPKRVRIDQEIAQEVRQKIAGIPGGRITVSTASGMGPGGSPIDIELTGGEDHERDRVAEEIKAILEDTEGVINVDISSKVGKPEITARVDRVRAAEMGFSMGQIASAMRTSVEGSTDTKYRERGQEYDIRVRLAEFDRASEIDVRRIVVGSANGSPVYLQDIATIGAEAGPTKVERKNQQRKVSVTADLMKGYHPGNVNVQLEQKFKELDMGTVQFHSGGEMEMMREEGIHMFGALLLSIALVYMLMAALFESMLSPFVIMFSLPMALIGAIMGLAITGETLSIVSMIGIIMLMGLVGKNAILLVDYTNTLKSRGLSTRQAILEAGPVRLRPILMTTCAMIGGMLPTALKLGRGAEMRAPMAIAVIGGLIVSSLLTLVVIPTLYTLVDDVMVKYQKRKGLLLNR